MKLPGRDKGTPTVEPLHLSPISFTGAQMSKAQVSCHHITRIIPTTNNIPIRSTTEFRLKTKSILPTSTTYREKKTNNLAGIQQETNFSLKELY